MIVRTLFTDGVREEPVLCSFAGFLIKRTVVGFPSILENGLGSECFFVRYVEAECAPSGSYLGFPRSALFSDLLMKLHAEPIYFILINDLIAFPGFLSMEGSPGKIFYTVSHRRTN